MSILNKELKSFGNATQPVNFLWRSQWIDYENAAEEKINELQDRLEESIQNAAGEEKRPKILRKG